MMIAPEPIFEPRGTPFSVVGRLKTYSDMGYKVDLLTYPIGEEVNFPGVRIIRIPRMPGIKKIKIGPSIKKVPLDIVLAAYSFRFIMTGHYDLIHTHEEAGFWGTLFAKIFRVPHIYDMHSSLPQQLSNFQFSKSRFLVSVFERLENLVLSNADSIITICPDLYNHVLSIEPEKGSFLIENVVDYELIFGEKDFSEEIKKKHGLQGKVTALYAGTLEPYQGIDLLIKSAGLVLKDKKEIVFLVVGGHEDQVDQYKKMAADRGVERNFIFTGQVSPDKIKSYMMCAQILLSPRTRGTNTPLKIYSYLKSGIPIVATRMLTHTQVMDESVAVLKDPIPEDFAQGITGLINNPSLGKELAMNAKKLADEKYSYKIYRKKLESSVENALKKGL